jgi:hypothetical protein
MTDITKTAQQAAVIRSPEEIYELSRRWIAEARARCKDKAAIEAWKRELQDWGCDMSRAARDHRLAGAARTASARRKVMDALQRTKR